ncbi:MAG TPA: nucleotidyltransferase domain-containing protein, partial [bacterium]|nr:nucleotidyltransferase domain-containing protein [bacterium]
MYVLDTSKIHAAIKDKGFGSVSALANKLKVHRNTLQYYLSGAPIINDKLDLVLNALKLELADVVIKTGQEADYPWEPIVGVVDELNKQFSVLTFVLFGSRARESHRKYSDWDIGVYSPKGLVHKEFRKLVLLKSELVDPLPVSLDLVNLNSA